MLKSMSLYIRSVFVIRDEFKLNSHEIKLNSLSNAYLSSLKRVHVKKLKMIFKYFDGRI